MNRLVILCSLVSSLALGQSLPLQTSATGGVSLSTSQTITGAKTFSATLTGVKFSSIAGNGNVGFDLVTDGTRISFGTQILYGDSNRLITLGGLYVGAKIEFGQLYNGLTDSSGTPGSATMNGITHGRSAIAASANTATITNNLVAATSSVFIVPGSADSTCVRYKAVPGPGSFVITMYGSTGTSATNCTATYTFDWLLIQG